MSILTALLPARAGIAVYTTLDKAAATARATGDGRTRGQIMADTLLARVTGAEHIDDIPIHIQLVMHADTLRGDDPTPARITGHGPIPAPTARAMAGHQDTPPTTQRSGNPASPKRSIRRVHTRGGNIVALDPRARRFTAVQRELLLLRDQHCRTPYCNAPVRHYDHITPYQAGGPTTISNGQGLCEACNYRKQHPDWHTIITNTGDNGLPHATEITTPTGHTYRSTAPPLVDTESPPDGRGIP